MSDGMTAKKLGIFSALGLLLFSGFAFAEPAPLELTMDKTRLVTLDHDAASVIVANPDHLGVSLDNPRLLMLTPHKPGATSMIVLDAEGRTILDQDIVISNVQKKYVRVRRVCANSDASGCTAMSYDYCPDGCYEVSEVPDDSNGANTPPPTRAPGLIEGEPAETMIGPLDDCPQGYNKEVVPGVKGDMHYTCTRR